MPAAAQAVSCKQDDVLALRQRNKALGLVTREVSENGVAWRGSPYAVLVGKMLHAVREAHGLSRLAFAKIIGVPNSTLTHMQDGEKIPQPQRMKEILNVLRRVCADGMNQYGAVLEEYVTGVKNPHLPTSADVILHLNGGKGVEILPALESSSPADVETYMLPDPEELGEEIVDMPFATRRGLSPQERAEILMEDIRRSRLPFKTGFRNTPIPAYLPATPPSEEDKQRAAEQQWRQAVGLFVRECRETATQPQIPIPVPSAIMEAIEQGADQAGPAGIPVSLEDCHKAMTYGFRIAGGGCVNINHPLAIRVFSLRTQQKGLRVRPHL